MSIGDFDVSGILKGSSKVVQIVASTYNTNVDSNSSTYAPTGLSATITPTSANNKVLVIVFQAGLRKNGDCYGGLRLLNHGGVTLAFIEVAFGYTGTTTENNIGGSGIAYLDSPASTSARTYTTEFNCSIFSGSGATSVQHNSATSSMLLLEVTP